MVTKRPPLALIDADIFAVQSAYQGEQKFTFYGGAEAKTVDLERAQQNVEKRLQTCLDAIGTDRVLLCFSDPARNYFRHDLYEEYKGHRSGTPAVLREDVRKYLEATYPHTHKPTLEADDCLGILQTKLNRQGRPTVIVSTDKDMKQIPGLHLNCDHVKDGVYERTQEEGDLYHLIQTLEGDAVDNYKGCPGIGEKKAPPIAEQGWEAVVAAFEKKGLTEEDALVQARLAKILDVDHWDMEKQEVKLWNPS